MIAAEVKEALHKRWPDGEYVVVEEAPEDNSRQGRKIDLLAISTWKSRRFEIDAVEVKVSMGDWKREVEGYVDRKGVTHGGEWKSYFWREHAHRFWVAVPAELGDRVKTTLPDGWGLLTVSADSSRVVVKAVKRIPEPLTMSTMVGIVRAAQDAGPNALLRAEQRGFERGRFEAGWSAA